MKVSSVFKVIATCLLLSATSLGQTRDAVSVRGAEWIEPIVTSPADHDVAGFAFPQQDWEDPSGNPFAVSTSGGLPRVYRSKTEVLDSAGMVWSGRTNELYLSNGGIYLWHLGQSLRKLWDGSTAGLAISNDGRRLAFWNLAAPEPQVEELVVLDIASARELRRWKVKLGWQKDMHHFDVWFGADGNVVYARTFELEDTRPLRAFEIDTGKTTIVTTNGICLAETADGIFYIAARGPYYVANDHYDLFKLRGRSQGELVKSDIPAPVCNGNRQGNRLAGIGKRRVWIYNTAENKFTSFPTGCDNVGIFSDGSLVFARKNRLLWNKCR